MTSVNVIKNSLHWQYYIFATSRNHAQLNRCEKAIQRLERELATAIELEAEAA